MQVGDCKSNLALGVDGRRGGSKPHLASISEAFAAVGSGVVPTGLRDSPTPTAGSSTFVFFGKMFSLGCSVLRVKRAVGRRRE